jgi:hypothetical protein
MMMVFMGTAVGFDELDPVAFNFVDGADMSAISANYFHVLCDRRQVGHCALLVRR